MITKVRPGPSKTPGVLGCWTEGRRTEEAPSVARCIAACLGARGHAALQEGCFVSLRFGCQVQRHTWRRSPVVWGPPVSPGPLRITNSYMPDGIPQAGSRQIERLTYSLILRRARGLLPAPCPLPCCGVYAIPAKVCMYVCMYTPSLLRTSSAMCTHPNIGFVWRPANPQKAVGTGAEFSGATATGMAAARRWHGLFIFTCSSTQPSLTRAGHRAGRWRYPGHGWRVRYTLNSRPR